MENLNNTFLIKDRFRGFLPVIVDVETAGFDPKQDALLEVGMMTISMDEHGKFQPDELMSANIRPFNGANINKANIDFLGIDPFDENRNLQTEYDALLPMFKLIKKKIKEAGCKRAILVGHNGSFDLGFIKEAAIRAGLDKKNPFHPFSVFDTASLSMLVYGQSALPKACYAAKISYDESLAHGAAFDTRIECELFCKLLNKFTTFCGVPEPCDVEIDYNKKSSE